MKALDALRPRARALLAWTAVAAVLLGVLWLYTRPALMVALADLVWACFN